jgi:hypothetical protein
MIVAYTSRTAKKKNDAIIPIITDEINASCCRKKGKYANVVTPKSIAVTMIPSEIEIIAPPLWINA